MILAHRVLTFFSTHLCEKIGTLSVHVSARNDYIAECIWLRQKCITCRRGVTKARKIVGT